MLAIFFFKVKNLINSFGSLIFFLNFIGSSNYSCSLVLLIMFQRLLMLWFLYLLIGI